MVIIRINEFIEENDNELMSNCVPEMHRICANKKKTPNSSLQSTINGPDSIYLFVAIKKVKERSSLYLNE